MKTISRALVPLLLAALSVAPAFAQGTAFNYQGQLNVSNSPANGSYQMQFALYANSTGGSPANGPVTNTVVTVTNGIFSTTIDFGANVFTGSAIWLDIAVRTNLPASFTELTPRQQILPVPYAIFAAGASNAVNATTAGIANSAQNAVNAQTAQTAESVAAGAINGSAIATGTLTASDFASGQVITNINGLTGSVSLVVTNNLALTANGNTLTLGGGNDFLCAFLFAQTESISGSSSLSSLSIMPVTTITTNGWAWRSGTSPTYTPVFTVPATGFYLINIDALPSTSNPEIGAYTSVGNGAYSPVGPSLSSGSPISHTFIAFLTAGNNLVIANASTGALQLSTALSDATLFSVTITRIN